MKSRLTNYGALVFLLLVAPVPAYGKSILEVRVLDQSGKPVPKAKVNAQGVKSGKVKVRNSRNSKSSRPSSGRYMISVIFTLGWFRISECHCSM